MGLCEIKEAKLNTHAKPITKDEIDELYSYESSLCKIKNGDLQVQDFFVK